MKRAPTTTWRPAAGEVSPRIAAETRARAEDQASATRIDEMAGGVPGDNEVRGGYEIIPREGQTVAERRLSDMERAKSHGVRYARSGKNWTRSGWKQTH